MTKNNRSLRNYILVSRQFSYKDNYLFIRNVYTGDLLSSLAVIKYKGKDKLDQLQINV